MTAARWTSPPVWRHDPRRFGIFVPAIMSVGLLFWIVTLVRDLFRWRGRQELERRSRIAGAGAAAFVDPGSSEGTPVRAGLRFRRSYLLTAVVLLGAAAYIAIGSVLNYARQDGYVSSIAWLMVVAVLVSAAFGFVGGIAGAVFVRWPEPPRALTPVLLATPLTRTPRAPDQEPGDEPSWSTSVAALLLPLASIVVTVVVANSAERVRSFDVRMSRWFAERDVFDLGVWVDPTRQVVVAALVAVLVGLAAWRCRALATSLATSALVAAVGAGVARAVSSRPGPGAAGAATYPSGSAIVAAALAGVLPVAIAALARRTSFVAPARVATALWAVAVMCAAVATRSAWMTDVVGGATIGASVALAVEWAIGHRHWHDGCRGCAWGTATAERVRLLDSIQLAGRRKVIRLAAHASAGIAAIGLAALTLWVGVPANSEGSLIDASIQRPVQLGLAGLVSIGALVAWRWDAAGAVLLAIAAAALGVFAGLQYRPEVAVLMTVALMVPAFMLWLGWQHRRRRVEVVVLAVVTLALVVGAWTGAGRVYDHYYGPTHPDSSAPDLEVDRVRWMWTGAVTPTSVEVVAGVAAGGERARLGLSERGVANGSTPVRSRPVTVSPEGIARMPVDGLRPGRRYDVTVEVDGRPDTSRGVGTVRTPERGPMSFTVAVGACARTGADGAVFDEIARLRPELFVVTGDFHYSNLESADPTAHRQVLERVLASAGPAALFRHVPVAYTWDDHDYGPNDAGAESPSRAAVRRAYTQVVPHYPIDPPPAPIAQAFTIGRVRFVMPDTRSHRTPDHMLGEAQTEWLVDELVTASRTHAVVVWVNSSPWVGSATEGADSWAGWPEDRRRIADALAAADVGNLVMVSGDAHMVAIDDGTNTDYSTSGGGGFPLLHAAALDRPGGVKGGPYSEGTFPGGGQFGTVQIDDDGGDHVGVRLAGRRWDGEELVSLSVRFDAAPGA